MNCLKSQNQFVNTLMFPGAFQMASYDADTFRDANSLKLIFIPFKTNLCSNKFSYVNAAPTHVQALLYVNKHPKCGLVCIHFHGNACDIGQIKLCAEREAKHFNCHYISVEFPRFGMSDGHPNEVVLNEVAATVHQFVINELRVPHSRIILSGRSVGSGIVCDLASRLELQHMPVGAVVLQSPYTSIRDAASDLLGCISFCMLNRWDNAQHLVGDHEGVIKSPVFFIHADNDKVIDCNHSILLHEHRRKHNLPCELFIQKSTAHFTKGHNFFDYMNDVVLPTKDFLKRYVGVPDKKFGNTAFTLPVSVIEDVSRVPPQFECAPESQEMSRAESDGGGGDDSARVTSKLTRAHASSFNSTSSGGGNDEETSIFRHPKCSWDIWCGFMCCPCVMCAEACCAVNYRCCVGTYYLLSGTKPLFDYSTLKPQDGRNGSVCNLIRRKESFDETQPKATTTPIAPSPPAPAATSASIQSPDHSADNSASSSSSSSSRRSGGKSHRKSAGDMVNPLLSHNFDTTIVTVGADTADSSSSCSDNEVTSSDSIQVNFLPG